MLKLVPLILLAQYNRPESATSPAYFEWLEKNSHIIYPALAILVLTLLVGGILQAWRTQDLDGLQKAELKREIVQQLRIETHGSPAEHIARKVGLEPIKLMKLLEEMQRDGLISSYVNTQRLTIWTMRGTTNNPADKNFKRY